MGTQRKRNSQIRWCLFDSNDYPTDVYLKILNLGWYEILIWMDRLEKQGAIIKCLEKTMGCVSEDVKTWSVRGKPKQISV